MENPYNQGLINILKCYAEEYERHKREGKSFPNTIVNCDSVLGMCRSIARLYKKELPELRKPECLEYAKRFNTDQTTLGDILSLIYYVLN